MNKIVFPLHDGMEGAAVANLQAALLALLEGKHLLARQPALRKELAPVFQKERAKATYQQATQQLVEAFQAERELKRSGNVDQKTALALNAELDKLGLLDEDLPPANGSGFGGRLATEHGQPAPRLRLRLYKRALGQPPVLLKEVHADREGRYRFDLAAPPAGPVALFSVAPDGEETRLTRTLFELPVGDDFDLVAPASDVAFEDEFSRLKAALAIHTGGKPETVGEAVEYGERRELTLLAEATGWEAGAIALVADAFDIEARTGLPAAGVYALARAGLPIDPRRLADVPVDVADAALREAAEAGILDAAQVAPSIEALGRYGSEARLEKATDGALSSAKDFAAKARISAEDKNAFTRLIAEGRGRNIWERAKAAGVSADGIEALQLQGKLAYLTFNNAELVAHLEGELGADPRALIGLGYFEAAHWKTVLRKLSGGEEARLAGLIPPAYKGKNVEARLDSYASELARRVRQMDPHAVTVERLASGQLGGLPQVEGVTRFLKNATPLGFRLGQTPLGAFCATQGDALWTGIAEDRRDAVLDSVRKLFALYSVSLDDAVLDALLRAGYSSATSIARTDYRVFKARVLGFLPVDYREGDLDVTEAVYARAQQQSATVFNVFDGLRRLGSTPPPPAATPTEASRRPDQIALARKKLAGKFPTLETLFGSVDYCSCQHCRSVLSPAAYLVDLLHFIDPDDEAWATMRAAYKARTGADYAHDKPFAVLDKRRPDLKNIALTCENTHTELPYIDVVNETLEQLMLSGTNVAIEAHDVGEVASADLIAEPQNIRWSAYVGTAGLSLREQRYPVSLPFDLPLEMARAFLRQLDLPLWRLRAAVARPGALNPSATGRADGWSDVWFERLGLGAADVAVLTQNANWHELYGYGYANAGDVLATVVENGVAKPAPSSLRNARSLARRLEIDYAKLVELVRTRFINPGIEHVIALQRIGIDPEKLDRFIEAGTPRMDSTEKSAFETYLAGIGVQRAELALLRAPAVLESLLQIEASDTSCDFSTMTLGFARDPAAPGAAYALVFHKMNALVRLHKKLGWEIHELDRLLTTLMPGASAVTLAAWPAAMKSALIHLAHVEELRERFQDRLSREEIAVLWSDIPATGWNCLYDRLFPGTGLPGRAEAFRKRLGRVLEDGTQTVEAQAGVICEAMQLTHADLAPILAAGGAPTNALTLPHLSILLRHALLAKVLGIKVSDLLAYIELSGFKALPLLTGTSVTNLDSDLPWSGTLAFVGELELTREVQADLGFIERICRHRGVEELADADADPALLALRALPPAQAEQEAAQRELVVKTLAAQLSCAVPTVDFLLASVLRDGSGRPLKETGFSDEVTSKTSLRRLRRAADLIRSLDVTTDELKYLHGVSGALDPGSLATALVSDAAAARATRQSLRPWLELVVLRKRFGRSDRILDVLAAARRQPVTTSLPRAALERRLHDAMAALTGLKLPALSESLAALGASSAPGTHFEVPALSSSASLMQMLDALKCFQRIGLDPEKVVEFATKPVDDVVARQLHSSLKARYHRSAWRRLVQPIFDGLRRKQRDVLVAHLTHVTRSDGSARYGETPEQLFEFLLLDPGMEPVVLASRIQLAISSVQLFLQRCLMNLEDEVNPQIIDARRWEWMRRYRVWEVNRKMFIWPENWLDPEFRDDKTHLFRALEGKLLQGDVNEDLVRDGFNSYLRGLEEIGRLNMVSMYFEPGISADGATLHVVGRSMNAPYKYFYRKASHGMWTPWEPIDAGIEGEHLVLSSWRGRMHLFWLSFLDQSQEGSAVPETFTPSSDAVTTSGLRPRTRVDLQLHWIECIKGCWVNRSSTPGFVRTEFVDEKATTDDQKRGFHVRAVLLDRAPGMQDDELEIHVSKGEQAHKFVFFSKLAPPTSVPTSAQPQVPPYELLGSGERVAAARWRGDGALKVRFASRADYSSETGSAPTDVESHAILQDGSEFSLLFPSNEDLPIPAQYAPAGIGRPTGFAYGGDTCIVAYRAADGDIYCLAGDVGGWNLHTASSEARRFDLAQTLRSAMSDPSGYALKKRGVVCIAYAGKTCLQELVLEQPGPAARGEAELLGTWRVETLYEGHAAKDRPVGRPLGGLFRPARGAVFLTADGRLRAVARSTDDRAWNVSVLNAGAPKAVSEPCGVVQFKSAAADGEVHSRHVFYLGEDGAIHELRSDAAGQHWAHVSITAHLHDYVAPAKGSALSAYPFRKQGSLHVVYRDSQGGIHELRKAGNGPWSHERIQAQIKMAAGDPTGYVTEYALTQHVVFRAEDDEVTELWWSQGKWQEIRLAQHVGQSTKTTSDIAGLSVEKAGTQHLFYLGEDGRPRRLWESGGWKLDDCRLASPFPDALGPLAAPFFYEAGATDDTFFVEPFVLETAVHEWTDWIVTTREYVPLVRRGETLRPLHPKPRQPHAMKENPAGVLQIDERFTKGASGIAPSVRASRGIVVP